MDAKHNSLDFVHSVIKRFVDAQIATWLSGGWAEELWGICSPRSHNDVDLLYPAPNFDHVDQWLETSNDFSIIPAKRFSHKRAVMCEQIMIELILLEPQGEGHVTNYFAGRYQLVWPRDTLCFLPMAERSIPLASPQALRLYRQKHSRIAEAYQAYLQQQRSNHGPGSEESGR